MSFLIVFVVSYIIGSFPTAFIICRLVSGKDIRTLGSGNVGATNVARLFGFKYGCITFLLDCLKGFLPVFLLIKFQSIDSNLVFISAAAVLLGHMWPVFLGFKGGKGVASGVGIIIALNPAAACVSLVVFAVVFVLFRYISLSSITAAVLMPFIMWYFASPLKIAAFVSLAAVLVVYMHKNNIRRLIAGTEPKFSFPKPAAGGGKKEGM
ncbi:MAG: glycerol-3-phosphate 1-O-acyltransferase PlsY [Candidatus Aureabacteria bacterium]|nr:glycerol-3-phosphate 1-O-acyltransferase PlsY [Candidatus Auribacterota bacterium]